MSLKLNFKVLIPFFPNFSFLRNEMHPNISRIKKASGNQQQNVFLH